MNSTKQRHKRILSLGLILALLVLTLLQPGCSLWNAFIPTEIVKHPDAPMQVLEVKANYLRVAVYDSENNKMIEYGWIENKNETLKGWALMKYDWEAFIVKERNRVRDERGHN